MRKVNIIPMAGEGQRFIDQGYKTPKPIIDVNGMPMIIRAAQNLPHADKWIFICRSSHINDYNIDKILNKYYPSAIIISVDELTEGQASTCLLAREYLFPDDQLTIGACDNGVVYNQDIFDRNIINNDALIWTFRNNHTVLNNPNMYGWVSIDGNSNAISVSCKKSISNNPLNDHAIIGTFSFKRAEYFLRCADNMIEKNRRINNEFYLDVVMDELIQNKYKTIPFEVEKYICWGTPLDLETYLEEVNR